MNVKIKRALLSVSDKEGIVDLAMTLRKLGVEIVSTGGTATLLKEKGVDITPIEKITGNPEAFGGRMKTISFQVGSALLYRRELKEDQEQAQKLGIAPIDLVVCNLYPFESTVRSTDDLATWVENIDIGGPTMIRAAAKNYRSIACVVSPEDYSELMLELEKSGGETSLKLRETLALKAFQRIASYDLNVAFFLSQRMGEGTRSALRYGENPHQKAALLPFDNSTQARTFASAEFIQGKELSYNNLLDADQAFKCASELNTTFEGKAVTVIVKHGNPCGVAVHANPLDSLKLAWDADSVSAFGGILAFNHEVTEEVAQFLKERFIEVVVAPAYSVDALKIFATKKNVRVMKTPLKPATDTEWTVRSIHGGILCQSEDQGVSKEWRSVTKEPFKDALKPTAQFGLVVTKYLKSNCIGLYTAKDGGVVTLASGTGQPNRLECISKLIAPKLKDKTWDQFQTVLVSDAFFPFRDSIDVVQALGVKYILQPGGSIRDDEVVKACDEFGIGMSMTGIRHFRH
ncbi:MAG: bifunctional phosphoribosylaminoimidazolecarboxamide formyltransferase/IMP cyclohydrolase [Bdellovibrionales bacterium]|nr:bifunctional phosphoribosylaminoimidazolecarboxamide formyltransferase/IMP cyclohydrolase [Bdellovibrionales bacterium]